MRSRDYIWRGTLLVVLLVVLPLSGCAKDTRSCLDDNSCETAAPTEATGAIRFPYYYCYDASQEDASSDATSDMPSDMTWDCSKEAAPHKIHTLPDKTGTEATEEGAGPEETP